MPYKIFIARQKSTLDVKDSKDRLTLLIEASSAGDFKMKPVLICHSENPRTFKNNVPSPLPVLCKWNNKAWMAALLFTTWFTECFKPTIETYCSETEIPFKMHYLLITHLVT